LWIRIWQNQFEITTLLFTVANEVHTPVPVSTCLH
jgi:hypothetical protein